VSFNRRNRLSIDIHFFLAAWSAVKSEIRYYGGSVQDAWPISFRRVSCKSPSMVVKFHHCITIGITALLVAGCGAFPDVGTPLKWLRLSNKTSKEYRVSCGIATLWLNHWYLMNYGALLSRFCRRCLRSRRAADLAPMIAQR
jgi:hypothetical protein